MAREDNQSSIGFLVHDVSRLRRTVVDKALRPMGITRSQWWVLSTLSRRTAEGTMQTELAKILDVGKVTLGGLIDRLESAGLVKRMADPQDRRAKRVVVTPKGAKVLSDIQVAALEVNSRIMAGISKSDIARAESVLHRMKQQLIAMEAVPGGAGGDDEDHYEAST